MDLLLAAARFVHYAAAIQLFGIAVFYWLLSPAQLQTVSQRVTRRITIASSGLMLISGVAWLMAAAAAMGDGPSDAINPGVISTVLTETSFGRVWGPRLLMCTLALLGSLVQSRAGWWTVVAAATLALGSLGLVGHASGASGVLGTLNKASQILHLLSSGFWLGALVPLLFCLTLFRDPARAPAANLALRRFSGLGHLAVALLIGTGVANSWFVIGADVSVASPYQLLLLAKVAIAGLMCALAIVNRYVFMPRIPGGGPGAGELARGTVAEIILGTGIIGLVSVIGMLSPH